MKGVIKALLILGSVVVGGCSADLPENAFVGQWIYVGTIEKTFSVDCPDVLHLQSDGGYVVLNDCYGVDPRRPVVERGDWRVDLSLSKLLLINRTFEINYGFINRSETLDVYIKGISEREMLIGVEGGQVEVYKRQR